MYIFSPYCTTRSTPVNQKLLSSSHVNEGNGEGKAELALQNKLEATLVLMQGAKTLCECVCVSLSHVHYTDTRTKGPGWWFTLAVLVVLSLNHTHATRNTFAVQDLRHLNGHFPAGSHTYYQY